MIRLRVTATFQGLIEDQAVADIALLYRRSDPHVVVVTITSGDQVPVSWHVGRELLLAATRFERALAGDRDGDIRVEVRDDRLNLHLRNLDADVWTAVALPADTVDRFLRRTELLVRRGNEGRRANLDRELEEMLEAS